MIRSFWEIEISLDFAEIFDFLSVHHTAESDSAVCITPLRQNFRTKYLGEIETESENILARLSEA